MDCRFDTAIKASKVVDDLHRQIRTLNYNKDLHKYLSNLRALVNDLGNAEVIARRSNKQGVTDEPREKLAKAVDYLEKLILIAKLSE
jgi:hypothetical protein